MNSPITFLFAAILTLLTISATGQDIIDDLINEVVNSIGDTTRNEDNLTRKDAIFSKLNLSINAVCRIGLINGNSIEGFTNFTSDGTVNALYFEGGKSDYPGGKTTYRLDLHFRKLIRLANHHYQILQDGPLSDTIDIKDVKNLYFLDWHSNFRMGDGSGKLRIEKSDESSILSISNHIKSQTEYSIEETFDVYPILSSDSYLRAIGEVTKVKMSEVRTFEFLTNPDEKWMQKIRANRIEVEKNKKQNPELLIGAISNWYHYIMGDKDLKRYIQLCIDMQGAAMGLD